MFINSCIAGHLGCFHVLAFAKSAVVNVRVRVLGLSLLWGVHVAVELRASVNQLSTSPAALVPAASKKQNGALAPKLWRLNGDSSFCLNCACRGHVSHPEDPG